MAYSPHASAQSRALSAIAIAALQGLVLLALVKGLAGVIVPIINPPNPQATNSPTFVPVTPPDDPTAMPDDSRSRTDTATAPSGDQPDLTITDSFTLPTMPDRGVGSGGGGGDVIVPHHGFTPRGASPLGGTGSWAGDADFPAGELRLGHHGTTGFRLSISAAGLVQDCTVTRSSGWPVLDALTCRLVKQRATFAPAIDGNGDAVAAGFTGSITWRIPENQG